jgi:hypothetical protein
MAENWCTGPPFAPSALQPAQLVSMADAPGVTEIAEFAGFPLTRPLPHPVANSSAGTSSSEELLRNSRMITFLALTSYSIDFLPLQIDLSQLTCNTEKPLSSRPEHLG